MFSHWANPPQGEAFGAGRGQGRSEEDQPMEWGLSGSPRQGLPMAAPGDGAPNSLPLRSALSVLSFFKAATELGDGTSVSENSTELTVLTKFQPFFLT